MADVDVTFVRSLLRHPPAEMRGWYIASGQRDIDENVVHYWATLFARWAGFESLEALGDRASFQHRYRRGPSSNQAQVDLYLLIDEELAVGPPPPQSPCTLTCEVGVIHKPSI